MLLLVIKRFAIFAILFGIAAGYSNYYAIDRPQRLTRDRPVTRIRRPPRPGRPEVNIRPPRPSPGRPEVNIRPPPQRRNNWGGRPQNPSWSKPRNPVWSQPSFDHYCIGLNKNIPDGDHIYQHYTNLFF